MDNNRIMCAVIKVDVKDGNPFYDKNYEIPYNVNVEEYMEFIKKTGQKYGIPITRVYLSGYTLASPNSILTKEKIENFFSAAVNKTLETNKELSGMKR